MFWGIVQINFWSALGTDSTESVGGGGGAVVGEPPTALGSFASGKGGAA